MNWLEKWLLPNQCLVSDRSLEFVENPAMVIDLSAEVLQQLTVPQQVCPQCCEPCFQEGVCGSCLSSPPAFDKTQVAYYFAEPLTQLVYDFKYHEQIAYGRVLASLLLTQLNSLDIEALLPVPCHPLRRRQRGFNQAEILAQNLASQLGIPVVDACQRIKHTPSQTSLTKTQRDQSLRGVFSVDNNLLKNYQKIALVDDVITTGATMNALAKTIKKHTDIKCIEAWAVAKTK